MQHSGKRFRLKTVSGTLGWDIPVERFAWTPVKLLGNMFMVLWPKH